MTLLYKLTLESGQAIALGAFGGDDKMLGCITGVANYPDFYRFIKQQLGIKAILMIVLAVLRHPAALLEGFRTFMQRNPMEKTGIAACLSSIVVEESAQSKGVGTALVAALDSCFIGMGISSYWLETRRNNGAARKFYTQLQFVEIAEGSRDVYLVRELRP